MEREAAGPGYWDDHQAAQRKMQQLGRLKDTVSLWRDLESRSQNLLELTELALAENDPSLQEQLEAESAELTKDLAREEINLTLFGPYDDRPAIVSIHAGAGGTDAQDWAEMLLQMYCQWAETGKRPLEVMDLSYGEEAGLRAATLEIGGAHAFGYLTAEQGVHRLVRLSPYDPNNLRQTSFAQVEILPTAEGGLGGAADPHSQRHRSLMPERTLPAPEPGVRHSHSKGEAAGPAGGGTGQGSGRPAGRTGGRRMGKPNPKLRAAPI